MRWSAHAILKPAHLFETLRPARQTQDGVFQDADVRHDQPWPGDLLRTELDCWRRFKIEPPCRLNFEPGLMANL